MIKKQTIIKKMKIKFNIKIKRKPNDERLN
jgi:hypothetical protein